MQVKNYKKMIAQDQKHQRDYICILNKDRCRCTEKIKKLRVLADDDNAEDGLDDEGDFYQPSEYELKQNNIRNVNITKILYNSEIHSPIDINIFFVKIFAII